MRYQMLYSITYCGKVVWGEVTKETRIYALPFLPQPLALSTLFEYDSWGRILNITYPDNEIVNYDYDLGGQLERDICY